MLAQAVDFENRSLARLFGLQDRGADGAAPGILIGNQQGLGGRANASRSAAVTPAFCETAPINATGASTLRPLTMELLKLRHGIAQAAQDLGWRVAFLLCVDHVAFGEHRTAPRDPCRASRRRDHLADLLHGVLHAKGLLIEERAGAGGALARAVVVHDIARIEADVLGALAADFEDGADLRIEHRLSCAR